MSLNRRHLLAALASLAAAPAFAAETPEAFVRGLYRGRGMPPLSVFEPGLRAEMAKDQARDWNRVNFDWLRGGQETPKVSRLKVTRMQFTEPTTRVVIEATFENWGEPMARRFELGRPQGRWLILEVVMSPEELYLTEVLAESINDAEP